MKTILTDYSFNIVKLILFLLFVLSIHLDAQKKINDSNKKSLLVTEDENTTFVERWIPIYKIKEQDPPVVTGAWLNTRRYKYNDRNVLLRELKYRWGFNYFFFQPLEIEGDGEFIKREAIEEVFPQDHWFVEIKDPRWTECKEDVSIYNNAYAYYVDEPGYRRVGLESMRDIRTLIENNNPNAKLIISAWECDNYPWPVPGYDCTTYDIMNDGNILPEGIMCSKYEEEYLPDLWFDFWDQYSNKFWLTWISRKNWSNQYGPVIEVVLGAQYHLDLLGYKKYGLNKGIWIYDYDNPMLSEEELDQFASLSSNTYPEPFNEFYPYLEFKGYQKIRDKYVYIPSNPPNIFPPNSITLNLDRQFIGPLCPDQRCDNSSYTLSNITVNTESVYDYWASNEIDANNFIIPELSNFDKVDGRERYYASFNAPIIRLQNGFHAMQGSMFKAYSGDLPTAKVTLDQASKNQVAIKESSSLKMDKDDSNSMNLQKVNSVKNAIPDNYYLYQNYPNPFNPSTSIRFSNPENCLVVIKIFDILGNEIIELENQSFAAGYHTLTWAGKNKYGHQVPSGVYFCNMKAGDKNFNIKMILMK